MRRPMTRAEMMQRMAMTRDEMMQRVDMMRQQAQAAQAPNSQVARGLMELLRMRGNGNATPRPAPGEPIIGTPEQNAGMMPRQTVVSRAGLIDAGKIDNSRQPTPTFTMPDQRLMGVSQQPMQPQQPTLPTWFQRYLGSVGQPGMNQPMPVPQNPGIQPPPMPQPQMPQQPMQQQMPQQQMPQQPQRAGMTNPAMNPMQFKKGGSVKKADHMKAQAKARAPANRGKSNMSALAKALKGK